MRSNIVNYIGVTVSIAVLVIVCFASVRQTQLLANIKNDVNSNLSYFKKLQLSEKNNLRDQLALLREEVIKSKIIQSKESAILGVATSPAQDALIEATPGANIKGLAKLKSTWTAADVFQEARASAKIIGRLISGKLYFIYEVVPNWYRIELSPASYGWIQSAAVDKF